MWKCVAFLVCVIIAVWFSLICFTKISLMGDELLSFSALDKTNLTNGVDGFAIESKRVLHKRKIRHHVPKFMLDLYERSITNGFNNNINHPDVVRSVIPKNAGFLDSMQIFNDYQDNHLLIFDVPSTDEDEVFIGAELKILTLVEFDPQYLNGLERIVKVSIYDDCTKRLFYLDEARVYHTNNTWLSFNMTRPVNVLLNQSLSGSSLKVVISVKAFLPYVSERGNKFTFSLLPVVEDFEHDYPVLLLTYSSNKEKHMKEDLKVRLKRSAEDDYEEETNNVWDDDPNKKRKMKRIRHSCKKKHLYVDFAEIHYDLWIVQPSGYEAYQCQGKCYYPVADHLSPTKHAIVQALLHSVSPGMVTRSCCVPTKLESISVLYVDNKGVLTYRYAYKDMVVTECGCR